MSLEQLLGDMPTREFVENFYLRQPFAKPGGARSLTELGTWKTVRSILAAEGVDAMLAREGQLWQGDAPSDDEEVRRLYDEGYTLVIRHAEKHDGRLAALAEGFAEDFLAPVNVHVYCTPQRQFGFGWHYDAEDVFIIQTEGGKEYSLRKNTVNPWPLEETIPTDMRYEREIMPVMKCRLEAGDWLYIPPGFWHKGESKPGESKPAESKPGESQPGESQRAAISLAVGVMSVSALDVLDDLRGQLLDSLLWRQRLSPPGKAAVYEEQELRRQYQAVFAQLADDLARRLGDPEFARRFLNRRKERHR